MHTLLVQGQPVTDACITEWQEIECSCVPPHNCTLALTIGDALHPVLLQPFLLPGDPAWRWRWNPQNTVGHVAFTLATTWPDGHVDYECGHLHIVPRKIDQEQYQVLLDDVQRVVRQLIFTLPGSMVGTRENYSPEDMPPACSIVETYYRFFRERLTALEQAVRHIAQHPHTQPGACTKRESVGRAHDFSHVGEDMARGQPVYPLHAVPVFRHAQQPVFRHAQQPVFRHAQQPRVEVPEEVSQSSMHLDTDTYENRLLKWVLHELWHRAQALATLNPDENVCNGTERYTEEIHHSVQHLARLRSLPFLEGVKMLSVFHGATHTIRHNPAYRQVYRLWQELQRLPALDVESEMFYLPVHELPRLYEVWCVVQVVAALLEQPGVGVRTQQFVVQKEGNRGHTVALVEDVPLLILNWHDVVIHLRYQPRYYPLHGGDGGQGGEQKENVGSLDCHMHKPDIAVEVMHPSRLPSVLLFDAKYRLTASGGVPEDALADMYTYLGSIGTYPDKRAVEEAVVLYPGEGVAERYASGVGVLGLVPGSRSRAMLREWVALWLQDCPA